MTSGGAVLVAGFRFEDRVTACSEPESDEIRTYVTGAELELDAFDVLVAVGR